MFRRTGGTLRPFLGVLSATGVFLYRHNVSVFDSCRVTSLVGGGKGLRRRGRLKETSGSYPSGPGGVRPSR